MTEETFNDAPKAPEKMKNDGFSDAETLPLIVPLTAEHIGMLADIDNLQLGRHHRNFEETRRDLEKELGLVQENPDTCFHLVALDLNTLDQSNQIAVGHVGAKLGGDEMVGSEMSIETLAIAPKYEGKGLATLLVLEIAKLAVSKGAESLGLEVRADNQRALKLYSRFGLAPVSVRKDYYPRYCCSGNNQDDDESLDSHTHDSQMEYRIGYEDAICMWCHDVQSSEFKVRLEKIEGEQNAR